MISSETLLDFLIPTPLVSSLWQLILPSVLTHRAFSWPLICTLLTVF